MPEEQEEEQEDTPDLDADEESLAEGSDVSSESEELASQSSQSPLNADPPENEVSESIEQFTSSEVDVSPPLPQRKRGGGVEEHLKKKSRTEENTS